MPVSVGVGGAPKLLTNRHIGVGGVPKRIVQGWIGAAGDVPKSIFINFSASVLPDTATASGSGSGSYTTNSVLVSTSGGGPYTYTWSLVSGNTGISATNPNGASTAFTATLSGPQFITATFKCAVYDGKSNTTIDVTVTVTIDGTQL